MRTGRGAVPCGHLAHDDGRADFLLGEAVGGRNRGVVQEGVDGLEDPQVLDPSRIRGKMDG
jgi:hypothetical protein